MSVSRTLILVLLLGLAVPIGLTMFAPPVYAEDEEDDPWMSEDTESEDTVSEDTVSEDTVSEDAQSEDTPSTDAESEDTQSNDAQSNAADATDPQRAVAEDEAKPDAEPENPNLLHELGVPEGDVRTGEIRPTESANPSG